MKQGADKPMPASVIASGVAAVHANAAQLGEEADLLGASEHWARTFALAHFAREELAKIPLLLIAGVRAAKGASVAWPTFRKLLEDHKPKWRIVVADLIRKRDYVGDGDEARIREELSVVAYLGKLVLAKTFEDSVLVDPRWHDNVRRWGTRRATSIYVGEVKGAFKKPSDLVRPVTAMTAVSRSRTAVRYYEPLMPAVVAFLADPPPTAPWPQVMAVRGRLLDGGVGGVPSNGLLD